MVRRQQQHRGAKREAWRWLCSFSYLFLVVACVTRVAMAQTFTSGSTGTDGALDLTGTPTGTVIDFDPATFQPPLDLDGDGIYHLTTLIIPTGVTVRLRANKAGDTPLQWLAAGEVVINGTLDLSGDNGHDDSPDAVPLPAIPGPGGFAGGTGSRVGTTPALAGYGPGGGCVSGGGAGYATAGGSFGCSAPLTGGATYGNVFLLPLIGGSGGAGGHFSGLRNAGGGGAGGGALLIASSVSITLGGAILANGGGGGRAQFVLGGGGSGGAIRLMAPVLRGSGTLSAVGGQTAFSHSGGHGRIRLETFHNTLTGSVSGDVRIATLVPNPLVLSTAPLPRLRITHVGGQTVPARPGGLFHPVDVTLNTTQAITIQLEGRNIPPGTPVSVTIISENVSPQVLTSSPLAGTEARSTASATATMPAGFSRIFTRATW